MDFVMDDVDYIAPVKDYFLSLQESICKRIEQIDTQTTFNRPDACASGVAFTQPRFLEGGNIIAKAACHFTHSLGDRLHSKALSKHSHLENSPFEAVSLSVIVHPAIPQIPAVHMNLRLFVVNSSTYDAVWFFGGGADLTPYIPYEKDIIYWHKKLKNTVTTYYSEDTYRQIKEDCDKYFYLKHRDEMRGVGGIFFDQWSRDGYKKSFEFVRSLGDIFMPTYSSIAKHHLNATPSKTEKAFLLHRRARYAEFNLLYDRGVKYGLESNRNIDSIMSSLPPLAAWNCENSSAVHHLQEKLKPFLQPKDWSEMSSIDT